MASLPLALPLPPPWVIPHYATLPISHSSAYLGRRRPPQLTPRALHIDARAKGSIEGRGGARYGAAARLAVVWIFVCTWPPTTPSWPLQQHHRPHPWYTRGQRPGSSPGGCHTPAPSALTRKGAGGGGLTCVWGVVAWGWSTVASNAKHAPSTQTLSGEGGGGDTWKMLPPGARTRALASGIPGVVVSGAWCWRGGGIYK